MKKQLKIMMMLVALAGWGELGAQALPTATREMTAQVGFGYTFSRSDFASNIGGVSAYTTFNFTRHIAADVEFHDQKLFTPRDIGEAEILAGARYGWVRGKFYPYAKVLGGEGIFQYQRLIYPRQESFTYAALALGGGVDVNLNRRINIRAIDFEYQRWAAFPNRGLTPVNLTFGAAYRF